MVATPSGVSLAPEGGAHQSVITPGIGVTLPDLAYYEPAFAQEVEWILLAGLRAVAERRESLYLRLSTAPVEQRPALPPSVEQRAAVLAGGYRLRDGRRALGWTPERAVQLFATGVMVTEALAAAEQLAESGAFPSVFVVTSPDRLYRGLREPRPYLETLVTADEEDIPLVSVLDGHSHALAFHFRPGSLRNSSHCGSCSSPGIGRRSPPLRFGICAPTFLGPLGKQYYATV